MRRAFSLSLLFALMLCLCAACGCQSRFHYGVESSPGGVAHQTAQPTSENAADASPSVEFVFEKKPAEGFLVLVNFDNKVHAGYRPSTLVVQNDVFGSEVLLQNPEGSIDETAALSARDMFKDALRAGMCRYVLTTAFRSVEYQTKVFQEKLEECGENYAANPYENPVSVLPGGASEHHTGLALDILSENHDRADDAFGETREGIWLAENAHRYGFILRYPKGKEHITGVIYEPWHFRYVGVADATFIYEHGLCLEEYVEVG